jgi:rare lipoprotein A (peptidoglycan hydrolase)
MKQMHLAATSDIFDKARYHAAFKIVTLAMTTAVLVWNRENGTVLDFKQKKTAYVT